MMTGHDVCLLACQQPQSPPETNHVIVCSRLRYRIILLCRSLKDWVVASLGVQVCCLNAQVGRRKRITQVTGQAVGYLLGEMFEYYQ